VQRVRIGETELENQSCSSGERRIVGRPTNRSLPGLRSRNRKRAHLIHAPANPRADVTISSDEIACPNLDYPALWKRLEKRSMTSKASGGASAVHCSAKSGRNTLSTRMVSACPDVGEDLLSSPVQDEVNWRIQQIARAICGQKRFAELQRPRRYLTVDVVSRTRWIAHRRCCLKEMHSHHPLRRIVGSEDRRREPPIHWH